MAAAMTEDMSVGLQKGLSEWWNEETEYVFQRIERWAAFARGYNRLRSERLSRGRLTMHEEQETRWTISSNKIVIEDPNWSPRFHNLKRSHRRKPRNDESCKINCCGTFDYQSNGNLDSTCLESYRYDHSIYFKTIGDIKSSKKESNISEKKDDAASWTEEQPFEWQVEPISEFGNVNLHDDDERNVEADNGNGDDNFAKFELDIRDVDEDNDDFMSSVVHNVWPIVDITKLSLDTTVNDDVAMVHYNSDGKPRDDFIVDEVRSNNDNNNDDDNNNNSSDNNKHDDCNEESVGTSLSPLKNDRDGFTRILSFGKQRRGSRRVRQPKVIGDNNVTWPGVLLNYTRNVDPATSPHLHRTVHVK